MSGALLVHLLFVGHDDVFLYQGRNNVDFAQDPALGAALEEYKKVWLPLYALLLRASVGLAASIDLLPQLLLAAALGVLAIVSARRFDGVSWVWPGLS